MCPFTAPCPNLWLYLITGIATVLNWLTATAPIHEPFLFRDTIYNLVLVGSAWLVSLAPLLNDMALEFALLSLVLILESIHLLYAAWRWVKGVIIR